jgi:hypothetical protein
MHKRVLATKSQSPISATQFWTNDAVV